MSCTIDTTLFTCYKKYDPALGEILALIFSISTLTAMVLLEITSKIILKVTYCILLKVSMGRYLIVLKIVCCTLIFSIESTYLCAAHLFL